MGCFCLDDSEQASATPRPLPVAKRSRFAGGSGAPRPVIRPLVTVTPFREIPAMCGPITMKTPSLQLHSSGKAHLSGGPPVSGGAIVSSRAVLQSLPSLKGGQLLFLFLDRAAGTLQRHTTAWRQWFDFARASAYLPGRPSVEQVLDFLCGLASGAVCARARVGSLRFLLLNPKPLDPLKDPFFAPKRPSAKALAYESQALGRVRRYGQNPGRARS